MKNKKDIKYIEVKAIKYIKTKKNKTNFVRQFLQKIYLASKENSKDNL